MRTNEREVEHNVSDIFPNRWSPRAFEPKGMSEEELMEMFEAARWAPSSYNKQPWFFLYGHRDTNEWDKLFDLLVDFNKSWAKDASVLVLVLSRKVDEEGRENDKHAFDAGSAWVSMALQASLSGKISHAMGGFDKERSIKDLGIPDEYEPQAMVALGYKGDKDELPEDLKGSEKISGRKKVSEFTKKGSFV